MDLIAQDKKVKRGKLTFILVRGIGAGLRRPDVDAGRGARLPRREAQRVIAMTPLEDYDWLDWLSSLSCSCLLLSAFFAGSETALTASSRASMLRLEKDGNRRAGIVNRLLEQRERLIGALLLGNNVVNILASALATSVLLAWFGDVGVVYATVVMTVAGRGVRRSAAEDRRVQRAGPHRARGGAADAIGSSNCSARCWWRSRRWCAGCSGSIGMTVGEDQPVLSGARGTARRGRSAAPRRRRREARPRHARRPARPARPHGLRRDDPSHRDDHRRTPTIRPRTIVNAVLAAPVTRIPLWRGKPENIVGILHAKDLLRAMQAAGRRRFQDRHRRADARRPGSCPTSARFPSSSRRSAAARPISRWWSTNTAR